MAEISGSSWSETDALNSSPAPNGFPEGMPFSGVNDAARAVMGAVKRFWGRINGRYASTGSSNAYVLTPDVALSAYVTGERYSFRANFANTGAATLNISSLGAKSIKKMTALGKVDLAPGDIQQGQPVTVEYDGTDFVMVTPVAPAGAAIKQGKHTISLTAGAGVPWTSSVPQMDYYANTYVKFWAWTLDASTNMGVMFSIPMPKSWNETSALEVEILWSPAAAVTGNVKWDVYISHQGDGDGDPAGWAVGPLSVTDASNGVQYALHVAPVINTGAIPNVSENDTINILIVRNAADAADTMAANALLRGIRVKYAVNAPSDD